VEIGKTPMPLLDPEFGLSIEHELKAKGVTFHGDLGLQKIENEKCTLSNGIEISAQFVILSAGVRPELVLAKEAGLKLGDQGGLVVNANLQTSDADIYAVGDMVEIQHRILNKTVRVPLAGPANRQGRIAAKNILSEKQEKYNGAIGSSVVKVFSKVAASTGLTELQAKRAQIPYKSITIHGKDHAGYYPGSTALHLKLIFDPQSRRLLGAEAFGDKGVEKRIDVVATALLGNMTVDDLAEIDLCYAPPFGSANDPVNMASYVAQNSVSGFSPTVTAEEMFAEMKANPTTLILDVRNKSEYDQGHVEGATLIPVNELRDKLSELPRDKKILVHCQVGFRGHLASRILQQHGFKNIFNVTGGYRSIQLAQELQGRGV
jgi:rhodanese-related sulfurtransferase